MITLHEVYKQGAETVKEAVLAFGVRHPLAVVPPDPAPDWKLAERHFTSVIEVIMGAAALSQPDVTGTVRRAENEAVQLLLALNTLSDYRCPICVKRGRGPL
ncbi:hypothetical protein [Streptomyces geranii]|uniref:hypothetical protein n=1 Tax=Streptomyces geranii TaxID=2058923 RepID=UPI000D03FE2B|nr:hypothetical protein [Streptomyces geranii]